MTVKNELKIIKEFKGEYSWLSNMYEFTIDRDLDVDLSVGLKTSVESMFQATKIMFLKEPITSENKEKETLFKNFKMNPYEARKYGKLLDINIKAWNAFRLRAMWHALVVKFLLNKEMFFKMYYIWHNNNDVSFIEENTWNDTYWGVCNGKGHNYLGKLLRLLYSEMTWVFYEDVLKHYSFEDKFIKELEQIMNSLLEQEYINKYINEQYLDKTFPLPEEIKHINVCFTGHRPNKGLDYNPYNNKELISKTEKALCDILKDYGSMTIYCGMALGFDQTALIAALNTKEAFEDTAKEIKIIAAVPCANQECKWLKNSQEIYRDLLESCDKVITLSKEYTPTCMQERNEYMVNNSDLVIAYWNGTNGGTGNTVKYAKSMNKPIINLYENKSENNNNNNNNNQKYDITIKNLNVESPIESYQIRVDRASILGNPYKMKNKNDDKERDEVCDKYEQYFIEQIKKGNELFAKEFLRLIEIFKKYNKLELFCWCAPKRCHAETLKKYIEIYLNKNNDNNNNNCKENNASCVVSSGETSTQEVLDNKKKEENNMKIIVHQVNCKGVMGAGFAKQVREAFPKCYEEYKNLCNKSSDLLGTYSIYKVNDILAIANIFGQYNYGVRAVYTNYEAFNNAFKKLRKDYPNAEIIAPYNIGCGLAGGDWEVVKPILDKYNIKTSKNIDLYNLSNNKTSNLIKNEIINNLAIGDIEFVDLTPSMFKGNNYILNKYFHYKDHSLDRPYLPELTKEEYENYVKTWGFKNEANRKYETATDYFKNMVKKQLVAKDLGIKNYKKLSFKGYKGNPENFEFSNYADNQRWLFEEKYIEDMFDPDRNLELNLDRKNSPYIIGDYKNEINEAWQFLTLCIRGRLVMLLNLENLIFTINNFIKNTDGLTSNCSNSQIEQLTNPIKNALKMLKDKELNAWIKQGNNDMTLYGINGDENTRKDYIETYQKILRAMLNIKPNESLEYFKDVFHYTNKYYPNLKDKYENIILRNEGLEMENLWDSQSADYDEDNEESIVDNPEYYENVLLNN